MTPKPANGEECVDTPVLTVGELGFSYGPRFALKDVTFSVNAGEFMVLLGPNGAGKTTLFAIITHLFEATAGAVRVCGWDMRTQSRQALARMGVVFQQPTLDLDLTVVQNLRYFAALHGFAGRRSQARIDDELERLELGECRQQRVRELSGGFRRRVEVARALLHEPDLLLLDEATVGLDLPTRARIVEHVHALARDQGIGVLWATHLIDEIKPGDQVIVMDKGAVKAQGPLDAVIAAAGAESIGDAFAQLTSSAPSSPSLAVS